MALRDTLKAASAQGEADHRFEDARPELIERWRASIAALEGRISEYLGEYIADGSLTAELQDIEVREDDLGPYRVQAMTLRAGPRVVRVQPIGRIIIGAVGRVDMYRQGRANSDDRYRFIRTVDDTAGGWMLRSPLGPGRGGADLRPLTKERVEAALDRLMR